LENAIYAEINSVFNLENWSNEFKLLYSDWLNDDRNDLHDIANSFYQRTLKNLELLNKNSNDYKLYLWFDVDRSISENFQWKSCPLTNTPLLRFKEPIHYLNRLFSKEKFLVFPDTLIDNNLFPIPELVKSGR
jgi:hypothetical protein